MRSCLICDDHAMVREALAGMVATRWPSANILQATDYASAWALAAQGPDLCLVDLDMPGADPRTGINGLRSAAPDMPLIVVTGSYDDALMIDVLDCGVAGFAPKQSTTAVLLAAIDLVLAGGRYLPPRLAELRAERTLTGERPSPGRELLSSRQLDVLRLLSQGLSNKDIARVLAVSPATIKTHVAQIMALMGVANRTQASMRARTLGLL